MLKQLKLIIIICSIWIITACSLAPEYNKPEMAVPQTWSYNTGSFDEESLELANFIKDERLLKVIETANSSNRSLRSKIAAVEGARATYRIARAELLPNISLSGNSGRTKESTGSAHNTYSVEAGLSSFEIDLFGKNRSLRDAALESFLAAESTVQAAKITLIGETITAWLTMAADQEQLTLAQKTMENAENSVQLTKKRHESGISPLLDVFQAETVYYQAKADVVTYKTQVSQDLNALELLAGQALDKSLLPDGFSSSTQWLGTISTGISSEVLLRRPDINSAEHVLKSANANIGAARAAFFPSITLISSAGYSSSSLSGLFNGSMWSFTGGVNLPIFSGGRNKANLEASKAKYEEYLADYDYAIQTAFREVADALARRETIDEEIDTRQSHLQAAENGYSLAKERYKSGIATYLEVLESQRTYYSSDQMLINSRLAELINRVNLYKAVGGGESHE